MEEIKDPKQIKSMVRPDAQVVNMKSKVDTLAEQLYNFTIIL